MADYSYTYLADGASLTGAQATAYFDGPKTPINAIGAEQLKRGTFGSRQAAPLYRGGGSNIRSLSSFQETGDHGTHIYDRVSFGNSLIYRSTTDFQADDGVEAGLAPAGTGRWTVIGHASTGGPYVGAGGPRMRLTMPSGVRLGNQSTEYVGGILVGLNCEVYDLDSPGLVTTDVGFAIQYQVGSTWYTIPRATRFVSLDDAVLSTHDTDSGDPLIDVPIRTLITADDLETDALLSTSIITGVRAMVSMRDNAADDAAVTLGRCNLSMLPLHCRVS